MQATELTADAVNAQFEKTFRCPTAIAQGVSAFNIPNDTLERIKAEQRAEKLRVQTLINTKA